MRGGGEVSVAWPGQGWNWGSGWRFPQFANALALSLEWCWPGPSHPSAHLPIHLSASGVWECWLEATREGDSRGRPPGAEV